MKKLFVAMMVVVMLFVGSLAFASEKVVYTVKAGDTLGELMFTWKVQGINIKEIHQWNPNLGTQVAVGQQIIYYLPDRPVSQKLSTEEVKKIVDETIAAQKSKGEEEKDSNFTLMLAIGLGLFCMIALAAFALYMKGKKQPAVKMQKETAKIEPKLMDRIFFVPIEENGLYEAEIEYDANLNRYSIPFCHKNGGDRIWKNKEGDARRDVQQCWRQKNKYGDQIDKLLAEGKIRQINNQAKA